jgi:hypothetical protein
MDRRPLPGIVYALVVEVTAPEAVEGEPQVAASVSFRIASAKPSERQRGRLPAELVREIAKLKGTKISAPLSAYGSVEQPRIELAKGVAGAKGGGGALAMLAESLASALVLAVGPVPKAPVGVGAYWMAIDRSMLGGVDVLRYRVIRVEKVAAGKVSLKVESRHYAASPESLPAGAPPGLVIVQFESQAKAELVIEPGKLLPVAGQVEVPYTMGLGQDGKLGRGGMRQSTTVLQIVPSTP